MSESLYLPESADPDSPLSVASLVVGLVIGAGMSLLVAIGLHAGFGPDDGAAVPLSWRMGVWTGFGASTIGAVLGVLGVFHLHHRNRLGIVGIALNTVTFLAVGLLVGCGVLAL